MTSLWELTKELEVGDEVAWMAERSYDHAGDNVYPNKVTKIEYRDSEIRVDGEGIGGGEYYYIVRETGGSEAYFLNPNKDRPTPKGPLVMAHLLEDEKPPVPKRRGFYIG